MSQSKRYLLFSILSFVVITNYVVEAENKYDLDAQLEPGKLFEPFIKPFVEQVPGDSPYKLLIKLFTPSTTTTTTTTVSPLQHLTKLISPLTNTTKLLEDSFKTSPAGQFLEIPGKITKTTGNVLVHLTGINLEPRPLTEAAYYDHADYQDPSSRKSPKYFSRECHFRMACEIGLVVKPLSVPIHSIVETNKLIQDFQNRYSRAITYGMLHGNCDRYYCLIKQFFEGPTGFTKGMLELLNRLANPDLYDV